MSIFKSGPLNTSINESGQKINSVDVTKHDFGAIYYYSDNVLKRIKRVWNFNGINSDEPSMLPKYIWPNHNNLFKFGLNSIRTDLIGSSGFYEDEHYNIEDQRYDHIINDIYSHEYYQRLYPYNFPMKDGEIDFDYIDKTNDNYTNIEQYKIYVGPSKINLTLNFRNCNYRYNKIYDIKVSKKGSLIEDFITIKSINKNNINYTDEEILVHEPSEHFVIEDTNIKISIDDNTSLTNERYGSIVFAQYNAEGGYYTGKIVVLNVIQLRDRVINPKYTRLEWYADESCTVKIGYKDLWNDVQYPKLDYKGGYFYRYFKILGKIKSDSTLTGFDYNKEVYYGQISYLKIFENKKPSSVNIIIPDDENYCRMDGSIEGPDEYGCYKIKFILDENPNIKTLIYPSSDIEDVSKNNFVIPCEKTDITARFKILRNDVIEDRKFTILVNCTNISNNIENFVRQEIQEGYEIIGKDYTKKYFETQIGSDFGELNTNGFIDIEKYFTINSFACPFSDDQHDEHPGGFHVKDNIYDIEVLFIDDYIYIRLLLYQNNIPMPKYEILGFNTNKEISYNEQEIDYSFKVFKTSKQSAKIYYYIILNTDFINDNIGTALTFTHDGYKENIYRALENNEYKYEVFVDGIREYDINKDEEIVLISQNIRNSDENSFVIKDINLYKQENDKYNLYTELLPGLSENSYYLGFKLYKTDLSTTNRNIDIQVKVVKCENYDVEIYSDKRQTIQKGYEGREDQYISGEQNNLTVKNIIDNVKCKKVIEKDNIYYSEIIFEDNNNKLDESNLSIQPPYSFNILNHGYSIEGNTPKEICNFKIKGTLKGKNKEGEGNRNLLFQITYIYGDESLIAESPNIQQEPKEENFGPAFIDAKENINKISVDEDYKSPNIKYYLVNGATYSLSYNTDDPKIFTLNIFAKNDEYRNGKRSLFGKYSLSTYNHYEWEEAPYTFNDLIIPFNGDTLELQTKIEDFIDEAAGDLNDEFLNYTIKIGSYRTGIIRTTVLYTGPLEGTIAGEGKNIEWFELNNNVWQKITGSSIKEESITTGNYEGRKLESKFLLNISGKEFKKSYKASYKEQEIIYNITQLYGTVTNSFSANYNGSDTAIVLNNITNSELISFDVSSKIVGINVSWSWKILPGFESNEYFKVQGKSTGHTLDFTIQSYKEILKITKPKTDYSLKIELNQDDYNDGTQIIESPSDPIYIYLYFPTWESNISIN